jgi:hypothetical protein
MARRDSRDAMTMREDDRAVSESLPVFAGKERWQVWRRKQAGTPAP